MKTCYLLPCKLSFPFVIVHTLDYEVFITQSVPYVPEGELEDLENLLDNGRYSRSRAQSSRARSARVHSAHSHCCGKCDKSLVTYYHSNNNKLA